MNTEQLNQQFEIPNALRFEAGQGGLLRAVVSTAQTEGELYLHGAHLTHWKPRCQQPVIFLSPASPFAPGKAIRGGVPIIFPWFGPRGEGKPGPAHGFARTMEWKVESARLGENKSVEIALSLAPDDTTRSYSPAFHLRFRATFGSELEMELETRNDSTEPFKYEEALHTYFSISDIQQISLAGLEGTEYIDKTDGFKRKTLSMDLISITKETDQMHLNTKATCVIQDPVWNRRIVIEKSGSDTTVVWNPWRERNSTMPDMASDSWQKMLCVESANAADNTVTLSPGASHKLGVTVRVESLP